MFLFLLWAIPIEELPQHSRGVLPRNLITNEIPMIRTGTLAYSECCCRGAAEAEEIDGLTCFWLLEKSTTVVLKRCFMHHI